MKNILITGSSNGFGFLAARAIAQKGHKVWASMRNSATKNLEKKEALESFSDKITVLDLDVTNDTSVKNAVEQIINEAGTIDVLINNAGVMYVGITEAYGLDQVKQQMDVNFYGIIRTIRAVTPAMRKAGEGLIINTSSLAGRLSFPYFGIYCASKFAMEGYSQSLRYELAPFGVEVSIVEPGPFGTNLLYSGPKETSQEVLNAYGNFKEVPIAMLKNFEGFFESAEAPDPNIVVNDYLKLIEAPKGQRPTRLVSGIDYGVVEYNELTQPIQDSLVKDTLQMEHLLSVV
ncbi:MAG: SDR family oxidoreductase [Chitinophagales bacterium]|nr:SDR family oxidoreductase [Chitinophagales bacterium]